MTKLINKKVWTPLKICFLTLLLVLFFSTNAFALDKPESNFEDRPTYQKLFVALFISLGLAAGTGGVGVALTYLKKRYQSAEPTEKSNK